MTPMAKRMADGYRISAVYYPVKNMARCLPPDEERAAAQARRTANEDSLLERQRAQGSLRDG